jgi:hypothetical protein
MISDCEMRIAELQMWDVRCGILDFALCPGPCALRPLTPDPPPAEHLKP